MKMNSPAADSPFSYKGWEISIVQNEGELN